MFNRKDRRIIGNFKINSYGFAATPIDAAKLLLGRQSSFHSCNTGLFRKSVVNTGFRQYNKVADYMKNRTKLNLLKET
jgi:hypothetical protein